MSIRAPHPLRGEPDFTWRGEQPTRVEALSDIVFAFALTLLVVSAEPPASFPELISQLWGIPGFAAAFAILLLIWHAHYIFFRRYGLEDGWTTTLNAGLLFLILLFVYPLKYLATMLSQWLQSVFAGRPEAPLSLFEAQDALVILSIGYAALFLLFALLYQHAYARRRDLAMTPKEAAMTRFSFWQQVIHAGGGASAALAAAVTPVFWAPFMGFLYFLIGPLIFLAGALVGGASEKTPAQSN